MACTGARRDCSNGCRGWRSCWYGRRLWAICGIGMANYLRSLWREDRGIAWVLVVAVAVVLASAAGFAVSEIAALSTVQVVPAQRLTTVHLGPGTYEISQDIGDQDFPDDATELSITGPGGLVPVQTVQPVLSSDDPAEAFLGAWDCSPVMGFTIRQAGPYTVTVKDSHGMSAAWISEPLATVAGQVFPWVFGIVTSLLTVAVCLVVSRNKSRLGRRAGRRGRPRPGLQRPLHRGLRATCRHARAVESAVPSVANCCGW
jgi:hypothetical protein